MKSIITAVMN